jgi:cyclase
MKKLSAHLYAETKYDWANVGAAVTEKGVVLLDSPVRPTDSKHWQGEVGALSPLGIRYLIATDYHGDHTTGAAFVKDVNFIAPEYVYGEISKGDNAFSKEIFTETLRDLGHVEEADEIVNAPVPLPQFCFEDTLKIHLSPLTFEIYRKGGHSPACTSVFVPEEGVLFSGDVVINGPSAGMRDANLGEWMEALLWVEGLDLETIVPGHGEICGKEVARSLRDRLGDILGNMKRLVAEGKDKDEAVADPYFEKYFHGDASRGEYWLQQRKDTFREGLERAYSEAKEAQGS